ncbi:hypothetical protein I4U23_017394 [Adineta vaga]|nr:hypothetical protein I4U23_017394 [Adineta vaga]
MPSVTDIQQQTSKISLNNDGKSTPPPPSSSSAAGMTTDSTSTDPVIQIILALEKKQRNLGKRKDKLESYQQEAKSGKELNKDQQEALAKYGEVLSQIECVKDLHEQIKKIQVDTSKSQKRLIKQAAEEKRLLISQRLREYAQLRYLLDHRPSTLKSEESSLLDELARVIVPSDVSLNTITRSVDIVLAIYQGGPLSSTVKTLTNRSSQEVRDILEQLMNQSQVIKEEKSTPPPQTQFIETIKQTPLVPQAPPSTPASVLPQREPSKPQQSGNTNDVLGSSLTHTHLVQTNPNEHPLQFDTRDQNVSYHQLMQDSPFFLPLEPSNTNNNQQIKQDSLNNPDNTQSQSNNSNHYMQSFNVHSSSQEYTQTSTQEQQQGMTNFDQDNSSNVVHSNNMQTDGQQSEEQWQHRRSNNCNNYRGGQYNGNGNKNYSRGGPNNYNQQQWRGPRGGHHDASYGGGQRQYNENNNNGGRGGSRGGSNTNYRGNRGGGGGNYRGGNRGNGNAGYNGNGYQRSSQYQHNNEQQSRPVVSDQQQ